MRLGADVETRWSARRARSPTAGRRTPSPGRHAVAARRRADAGSGARNSGVLGSSTSLITSITRSWRASSLPPKSWNSSTSSSCLIDAQRRVERGRRILRHVGDELARGRAAARTRRARASPHRRSAPTPPASFTPRRAWPSTAGRRWSCPNPTRRPGRAPRRARSVRLTSSTMSIPAARHLDPQVGDGDRGTSSASPLARSMPAAARDSPSPMSPVPIVSKAIAITGRVDAPVVGTGPCGSR